MMTVAVAGVTAERPSPPGAAAQKKQPAQAWNPLEPGLDLGEFPATHPSERGDSIVRVLRVDPNRFDLRLMNASAPDQERAMTARDWCVRGGLVAAINASMYQTDHRTSVSLMKPALNISPVTPSTMTASVSPVRVLCRKRLRAASFSMIRQRLWRSASTICSFDAVQAGYTLAIVAATTPTTNASTAPPTVRRMAPE